MNILIDYLIFPGFLFTIVVGILASWIDRKVTARVQWRVGPPLLQPLYDIIKLLGKETIVPQGNKFIFLSTPLFGLASVIVVSTLIWKTIIDPGATFLGDIIVILYLLTIPAIALIIGGFSSRNPLASIGASREMKLVLAYELPFILSLIVPIIKSGSIRLGDILVYQLLNGILLSNPSGIIVFIVAIICMQAKLGLVPFDIAEAETEISSGIYIEYSGTPLAIIRLTRYMMLFVVPMFLVSSFMGGIYSLSGILKYVILLVLVILIRNTNPRVRIDQAVKFFWGPMTVLAVIGIILALCGI